MADERHRLLSSFSEHRDALLRFLQRRLNNFALAEDLTQETWLRAASTRNAATIDNPRGFLFRIASNLALDHRRHVGHRIELAASPAVTEAVSDRQPSPENVSPPPQRTGRAAQAGRGLVYRLLDRARHSPPSRRPCLGPLIMLIGPRASCALMIERTHMRAVRKSMRRN